MPVEDVEREQLLLPALQASRGRRRAGARLERLRQHHYELWKAIKEYRETGKPPIG